MASREELEALHPTRLAGLCQQLAQKCSDPNTVARSRQLMTEYDLLQAQSPPSPKDQEEKDAKRWDLHQRMVGLLENRNDVEFYPKS